MRNAKRRYAVLAPGQFAQNAKTAHGVIRYGTDEIAAVVDPDCAGKTVREVVPYLECDAPIVATVREALEYHPRSLLIGTAPKGGKLPPDWRAEVLTAIRAGLEIVSGLHDMLGEDEEFVRAAEVHGATIWDVRRPPDVPLFTGEAYGVEPPVVLAVGNDCAVGKMTVMLELARAAKDAGKHAEFVPTGQTGIMIAGWGIAIDRVISDFATGATEQIVLEAARRDPDYILVEGQGGINHPAYAPVTLSLMYGAAPDELILVVDPTRVRIEVFETPTLSYRELIRAYESLCATVKPAKVIGIALNTRNLTEERAVAEIERARAETMLPADDVVRFGPHALWNAIAPQLVKRTPLSAEVTPA
ncbi:MAG TPA: DUF1611 domain-containing protein [Candidatus Baltobacteraceae bacterium]|nr:DUF1611 domain-containing protein [Candidatus Baltobacteraceae bacterium]